MSKKLLVAFGFYALLIPGEARPNPQEPAAQPTAPAAKPKREDWVLIVDGRLIRGVVSEEDSRVVVTQSIGLMKFPAKKVEGVFSSLREVYEFKLRQLPEKDFDERIKFARWCLAQNLQAEAKQQLNDILAVDEKYKEARAMLISLEQAEIRLAQRGVDPDVRQTSGDQVMREPGDSPATLDASVLQGARRGLGISGLPVIFDLPAAQAVKRTEEFRRYVNPVLQAHCVKCHNERYDGEFQLVDMTRKADRTVDALRANLDATLQWINREDPRKSELLSSTLRPHGPGKSPRPIFKGSNDGAYQTMAAWVSKLQAAPAAAETVQPRFSSPNQEQPAEGFATDRGRVTANGLAEVEEFKSQRFNTGPVDVKVVPPMRAVPGVGMVEETGPINPKEFPVPFAVSGSRPVLNGDPIAAVPGEGMTAKPRRAAGVRSANAAVENEAPASLDDGTLPDLPTGIGAAAPAVPGQAAIDPELQKTEAPTGSAASKKAKKPIKIDPALLQKALQQRNQN